MIAIKIHMKLSILAFIFVLIPFLLSASAMDCKDGFEGRLDLKDRISKGGKKLVATNWDKSTKFSAEQRGELQDFLLEAVKVYHERGSFRAYQYLRSREKLVEEDRFYKKYSTVGGMEITSHKTELMGSTISETSLLVNFNDAKDTKLQFDKLWRSYLNSTSCCNYDPNNKRLSLPMLEIKNYDKYIELSSSAKINKKTKETVDAITEQLFLAFLEEYTHALQTAYGTTLSKAYHLEFSSYMKYLKAVEMDLVLVFQEWGVPLSRTFMERYQRIQFMEEKALPFTVSEGIFHTNDWK